MLSLCLEYKKQMVKKKPNKHFCNNWRTFSKRKKYI